MIRSSQWQQSSFNTWLTPGAWFSIKMSSYQHRKSHCGDKTILRPSYLHNGISYTGKTASLYWIRALDPTISSVEGTTDHMDLDMTIAVHHWFMAWGCQKNSLTYSSHIYHFNGMKLWLGYFLMVLKPEYSGIMPWLLALPGHQQP